LSLRILILPACAVALALPVSAAAQTYKDLRSPDARDAAREAQKPVGGVQPEPVTPTVVHTSDTGGQTLPIVLSSMALVVALAGIGVALGALYRRPRPRWTAR
jgi:hypothetical protein